MIITGDCRTEMRKLIAEIAEKDKEIERLREAMQTIYSLCSSREDYVAVNIEVGMTAMKALKEQL